MSYNDMRRAYKRGELSADELPADPLQLFTAWLELAVEVGELEPNAMALATVGEDGQPRARFVLLKDATPEGFVFFTNYESRKGHDLAAVPRASLAFWWARSERQVRVDGAVTRLDAEASDAYFASRPHGSQIGAWASHQSAPIEDRQVLVDAAAHYTERFGAGAVPRPPFWGGYLLTPERMEFWQGRDDRLHDRFEYRLEATGWSNRRLSP
jgi:pyridoxamine 5'-phosphate oxidase